MNSCILIFTKYKRSTEDTSVQNYNFDNKFKYTFIKDYKPENNMQSELKTNILGQNLATTEMKYSNFSF